MAQDTFSQQLAYAKSGDDRFDLATALELLAAQKSAPAPVDDTLVKRVDAIEKSLAPVVAPVAPPAPDPAK